MSNNKTIHWPSKKEAEEEALTFSLLGKNHKGEVLFDNKLYAGFIQGYAYLSSRLQPDSRWISVKERLPDKEGTFLICYGQTVRECWYNSHLRLFYNNGKIEAKFWMPLPSPPKTDTP